MARKKIREYTVKQLVLRHLKNFSINSTIDNGLASLHSILVTEDTSFKRLKQEVPELNEISLVAKPDMCFGKRGKNNLVCLNKTLDEVHKFVDERMLEEIQVGKVKGKLTHFLIERFVPHKDEYYFSITSERENNIISFSLEGGIEVEENWDKVRSIKIGIDGEIETVNLVCFFIDLNIST